MNFKTPNILLADDDPDDCIFFKKALERLPIFINLNIVRDGEKLMEYLLENQDDLPDVLFLDLSMPKKNGFECLTEIKQHPKLKNIQVVMFTTAYPRDTDYENNLIKLLLKIGASDFISKSPSIEQLGKDIQRSLALAQEIKPPGEEESKL
jgi:CheY-like chemotaxis protein